MSFCASPTISDFPFTDPRVGPPRGPGCSPTLSPSSFESEVLGTGPLLAILHLSTAEIIMSPLLLVRLSSFSDSDEILDANVLHRL